MPDEVGTEATRSDVQSADESLFGEAADDTAAAVVEEEDPKGETPNPPPNLVGVGFVVLQDVFVVDSASHMLRLGRKEGFGRRF